MSQKSTLELIQARRPRWALDPEVYNSDTVYQDDLRHIWYASWIFAGHTFELKKPGSYLTLQIGDCPVVVVRDSDGEIRAYHNACQHRGHRICTQERGNAARLVCPYHRWTYDYKGQLVFAPNMGEGFNTQDFSLRPVHVGVTSSYIYVCVADQAPDFSAFARDVEPFIAPHQPEKMKVAHMTTAVEQGNWKLVFENNRECYHCDSNHPELLRSYQENNAVAGLDSDEDPELQAFLERCEQAGLPSRLVIDADGQYRMTRIPLSHGASSYTMDGLPAVKNHRLDDSGLDNIGALLYFHYPNTWNHWMGDHAVSFQMLPLDKNRTQLVTKWLVPEDAVEGVDYDLQHLTHVWEMTNAQDAALVGECQIGTQSPGYTPGPYSEIEENGVCQFVDWYCQTMQRKLEGLIAVA